MYLIHQHYCNSMSGDNSYVYAGLLDVNKNIHDFIYGCISKCDDTTSENIYNFITSSLLSTEQYCEQTFSGFKVEVYPATLPQSIATIYIDNEEDSYKLNIIEFTIIDNDIDNLYSSL